MSFNIIDVATPAGTTKKKFIDDYMRELKTQVAANLAEISNYPHTPAIRESSWTTATRPTTNLVDGLSGYNSTLGCDEHWDATESVWVSHGTNDTIMATIQAKIDAIVPIGMISLWSGSSSNIPTGWALCNGANGTPNLLDRFVVGAGSSYAVGGTGGEATHTLTAEEMPSHTHTLTRVSGSKSDNGNNGGSFIMDSTEEVYGWQDNPIAEISPAGSGAAHNNLPPYYALCYIMRVS